MTLDNSASISKERIQGLEAALAQIDDLVSCAREKMGQDPEEVRARALARFEEKRAKCRTDFQRRQVDSDRDLYMSFTDEEIKLSYENQLNSLLVKKSRCERMLQEARES